MCLSPACERTSRPKGATISYFSVGSYRADGSLTGFIIGITRDIPGFGGTFGPNAVARFIYEIAATFTYMNTPTGTDRPEGLVARARHWLAAVDRGWKATLLGIAIVLVVALALP